MICLKHAIPIILAMLATGCGKVEEPEREEPVDLNWLSGCERPEDPSLSRFHAESLCGVLQVPEDPDLPSGRAISVAVMVTPALSARTKPDPVVFLAGGPGQAASDLGPLVLSTLREVRVDRDIVFVDQRGTGGSNALDCELSEGFFDEIGRSPEVIGGARTSVFRDCLDAMQADPRLYTTPIAMNDLERVRKALGYEKINLYGVSYGTRAALVYMRRYGGHVRSAILDGVVPLPMNIPANIATDADAALERLFVDCEASPGCRDAFPDLRSHYAELVERLKRTPEKPTLVHPRTGRAIESRIDFETLSNFVRATLYERTLSALLPFALEEAFRLNYQPLATLAYSFTGEEGRISIGMMATVLCSEDMKFISRDEVGDGRYFVNSLYERIKDVCEFWPAAEIDQSYKEPVGSDIPVLLISGRLDPVTPPQYASQAKSSLTSSRHIVVPGVAHGASFHGCMPRVMERFLDDPRPDKLDDGCIVNFVRPPFFTGYAGPISLQDGSQ